MKINYHYKPFRYFFSVIFITWLTGAIAAFASYSEDLSLYKIIFLLMGMLTPFIVAMIMIFGSKSKSLQQDFKERLFNIKLIKPKYWFAILFTMPSILIIATSISLLFGESTDQFSLASELLEASGAELLIVVIILALAPTFEELGWRGYGVDSLRKGRTIFSATLLYALLWNMWHWPLFFVDGYYQNELIHTNIFYAINFVISIFPAAFLMNWVYYKFSRSILAIILLHMMINLSSVILQTEQFTKCIITLALSVFVVLVLYNDRRFFFKK